MDCHTVSRFAMTIIYVTARELLLVRSEELRVALPTTILIILSKLLKTKAPVFIYEKGSCQLR